MLDAYLIGSEEAFDAANAAEEIVEQRIAPYCDAPQTDADGNRIVQRFTLGSARRVADAFNGSVRRLLDRLPFASAALPCYNGHPDHANGAQTSEDATVYARVESLEAREDGLWARIRKYPALANLKAALGRLEISPRWLCRPSGGNVYEPYKLISLGFVKRGNLPGADVINEKNFGKEQHTMNEEQIERLSSILGLTKEQIKDPEAIITACSALKAKAELEKKDDEPDEPKKDEPEKKDDEPDEPKKDEANSAAAFAFAVESKLSTALANGQITPADKDAYKALLTADFVNASRVIDALPKAVKTDPSQSTAAAAVDAANAEKALRTRTEATAKVFDLVNAEIAAAAQKGERIDTDEALLRVRATKNGAELYAAAASAV